MKITNFYDGGSTFLKLKQRQTIKNDLQKAKNMEGKFSNENGGLPPIGEGIEDGLSCNPRPQIPKSTNNFYFKYSKIRNF